MSSLQSYSSLFAGRTDVYARITKVENEKARYMKVSEPLATEVVTAHLKGEIGIGVYPIVNNMVKWGLVDIDGPKGDGGFAEGAWEQVWPLALEQLKALQALGLHAYIERSRSGKGAHVWIFLEDWTPAADVRAFLYRHLTVEKRTFEVVYPVQSASDGFGSLIALPYNGEAVKAGNSVFLTEQGEVVPLRTFLKTVRRNKPAVFAEVAQEVDATESYSKDFPPRPNLALRGSLKVISPFGCKFMHNAWVNRKTLEEPAWHVAIQQTTCFHRGRELAHAISRDYPGYSPQEVDQKFDRALTKPVVSCGYIQENFPHLACSNCPGKAPYEVANKTLIELAQSSSEEMERVGSVSEDLDLVREYDSGRKSGGIEWGVPLISRHHRLRDSEMVIVGGFPSLGKTWFLIDNAVQMARRGVTVFIFSAETARKQLRQRLISNISGVELTAIRGERELKLTSDEWRRLREAGEELGKLPIYTDFTSMSPNQVLNQVEDVLLRDKIPFDAPYVIFFDYLQFGFREPGEESDTDRIGRLAGEFKLVSKVLEHPSVILSQLRRDKEVDDEDEDVRPDLNWYASSSNIERTADGCFILTGKRIGGLYAPRTLWKVKDRDGQAPMSDVFVLEQPCGQWKSPVTSEDRPSLLEDFNATTEG